MHNTYYARLHLQLDGQANPPENATGIFAPEFLKRFTYQLKITPKLGLQTKHGEQTYSGQFKKLKSADHVIKMEGLNPHHLKHAQDLFKVTWNIYFDGKLSYSIAGKLFDQPQSASSDWFKFNIQFTHAKTQLNTTGTAHVVTQTVSIGVGWYLVKQTEAMGDLMTRAFRNPGQINWDVIREVNSHLGPITTLTLLKPGQVVIISKTKSHSNPKLKQMKAAAIQAQAAWKTAYEDQVIDATEMALIDLLIQGHQIVPIEADEIEGLDSQTIAQALKLSDDNKPYIDSALGVFGAGESVFDQANAAKKALTDVAQDVRYTNKRGTNSKANTQAKAVAAKPYKLLNESKLARNLVYWDTGIKANRARDYIAHEVQLRSANKNGGIQAVAKNIGEISKISKWLGRAGWVGIAFDASAMTVKAYDAYDKGDVKVGNVEVGKGAGSIVGGIGAGFAATLIFGVATGGVGLVVIGVATATIGYFGGKGGEWLGGEAAEINNDGFKKYAEEQLIPSVEKLLK